MTDVEQLLADYVAAYEAGEDIDPFTFIDRLDAEDDRVALSAEIDRYLADAPRQSFAPEAFASSLSARVVDDLERVLAGQSGTWPAVLPQLRARAGIKRTALVEQLSSALGVSGKQEKVAAYYHDMEQGLLPSSGVSDRVLSALGNIVGETVESLKEAGRTITPSPAPGLGAAGVFARQAQTSCNFGDASANPGATESPGQAEWDEVDELFRGA